MKPNKLTMIFLQIIATTVLLIMDAKAGNESVKSTDELIDERDMEMETIQEKDVFPDLLSFATHLYQ